MVSEVNKVETSLALSSTPLLMGLVEIALRVTKRNMMSEVDTLHQIHGRSRLLCKKIPSQQFLWNECNHLVQVSNST